MLFGRPSVCATASMMKRLVEHEATRPGQRGIYCCCRCSCALWRHLAAGGLEDAERRLAAGMKTLKAHRNGDGKWRTFPFYYTLLALTEVDLSAAAREMRYAAPQCEKLLKRRARDDEITHRRRVLAERVLVRC